ncbi:hypothetical protein C8R47DRAFT_1085094 [Mycena vitilis]|nr:hypothetical protein C8R47DRAFT_1085094 [Mycena vitilis]
MGTIGGGRAPGIIAYGKDNEVTKISIAAAVQEGRHTRREQGLNETRKRCTSGVGMQEQIGVTQSFIRVMFWIFTLGACPVNIRPSGFKKRDKDVGAKRPPRNPDQSYIQQTGTDTPRSGACGRPRQGIWKSVVALSARLEQDWQPGERHSEQPSATEKISIQEHSRKWTCEKFRVAARRRRWTKGRKVSRKNRGNTLFRHDIVRSKAAFWTRKLAEVGNGVIDGIKRHGPIGRSSRQYPRFICQKTRGIQGTGNPKPPALARIEKGRDQSGVQDARGPDFVGLKEILYDGQLVFEWIRGCRFIAGCIDRGGTIIRPSNHGMEENIHSGEQVVAADFIIISDETDKIHKLLDHEETHSGEGRDMVAGDGIETVAGT